MPSRSVTVLMADDDQEDRMLAYDALKESGLEDRIRFVCDGEELIDYLLRRGQYADPAKSPRPNLILLDLNMPRKDGREALHEIRKHDELKQIPIVVFTTSTAEEDIWKTYDLGVSSYVSKPRTFTGLVQLMKALCHYWLEVVLLPDTAGG